VNRAGEFKLTQIIVPDQIFLSTHFCDLQVHELALNRSTGILPDAITISIAAASVGTEINQDGKAEPNPIEDSHAARRNQQVRQGRPGREDQAQDGPDETLEYSLIVSRPDQPPD
jgi:hypothetical protein